MIDLFVQAGLWLAVILTMSCYTNILWRDNKIFRIAEATMIGVGLANEIVINVYMIKDKAFIPMINGKFHYAILFLLGILIFLRVSVKYGWLSRFGMAILVGTGTGLAMLGNAETNFWKMVQSTFVPIIGGKYLVTDNLYTILATFCILYYFFFTYKPKKGLGYVNKAGRYFMIFALGGQFGNTVLARLTWLTGRIGYLVRFFMNIG